MSTPDDPHWACPLPHPLPPRVTLAHGGGGAAMQALIRDVFLRHFDNPLLRAGHDAAVFDTPGPRIAFTTDSFVVQPLEFPGGDIGRLAVYGTVNDLAMAGARPTHLSTGFILEEGLPMATLDTVVRSMRAAADACGVTIVTGDTKVVERQRGDGLTINTAGIGAVRAAAPVGPASVRAGDAVLISGDIARHGIAVMAAREGLAFDPPIESDAAPLHGAVAALIDAGIAPRCLRDCTRGGLAAALNEIALGAGLAIDIDGARVPLDDGVRGACEILGLDPLHVACEGRFVAVVAAEDAPAALDVLAACAPGLPPAVIGAAAAGPPGRVTRLGDLGVRRLVDLPAGEQLPRIC